MSDVLFFRQATYAHNTKRTYRTHQRAYTKFCELMKVPLVPASSTLLCMYAAYLARFLLPRSVCLYLNFVGLLHKEFGFINPLSDNWALSTVLTGIKRVLGTPPKPRLPISIDLLRGIRSRLNLNSSRHASFWAICLVSFFGLFRKSHLLPVSAHTFNPKQLFTRADFSLFSSYILINVRWSKTIQLGQRIITIPLVAIPSSPLCPVSAVKHAFSLSPSCPPEFQAFCWHDSSLFKASVFTYKSFMTCMRQCLTELGIKPDQYGSHSFRRGGATFALEAGVALDTISLLGDWKSDAMFLYLNMPLSSRISAQQTMASYITTT